MVGIYIDEEVRARMRQAGREERIANAFATFVVSVLFIAAVGGLGFLAYTATHQDAKVQTPPPVKVEQVQQHVT